MLPAPELDIEAELDSDVVPQQLKAAIADLSDPRERDVIVRRYFHGWTLKRVGFRHGISRERVRQIEARALMKLRRRVEI